MRFLLAFSVTRRTTQSPCLPQVAAAPEAGEPRSAWFPVAVAVSLVLCAFLTRFILANPEFLISSDSLFPAAFVDAVLTQHTIPSGTQYPHIPSFFPDLVVVGVTQAVTGSWRIGYAIWVFVVLSWIALGLSWIVSRIVRVDRLVAAFSVMALLMLVMVSAAAGLPRFLPVAGSTDPFFPWLLILIPCTHGGPFLLALTAASIASRAVEHPSALKLAALGTLCFVADLSDQLFLISLLVPLTAAVLGGLLARTIASRSALYVLGTAWVGAALASGCLGLLDRQPMPLPGLAEMLCRAARFAADVGQHGGIVVLGLLGVGFGGIVWRKGFRGLLAEFWPVFAATAAGGSLLLTALLYEDVWSWRYALPALWWALVLAAAWLAEAAGRWRIALPAGSVAGFVLCLLLFSPDGPSLAKTSSAEVSKLAGIAQWETPLAACLRQNGSRAGLADFWLARKTSAASDWAVQVEPIDSYGQARVWGNDPAAFAHDVHARGSRPDYRFIIMDRLPEERISAVYGAPDRVISCGGTAVWVYDEAGRIYRALEQASPFLAAVFAAAPDDR